MNWGIEDFIAAAILLGAAALGVWAVRRFAHDGGVRLLGYGVVIATLVIIWAELAVGIFH